MGNGVIRVLNTRSLMGERIIWGVSNSSRAVCSNCCYALGSHLGSLSPTGWAPVLHQWTLPQSHTLSSVVVSGLSLIVEISFYFHVEEQLIKQYGFFNTLGHFSFGIESNKCCWTHGSYDACGRNNGSWLCSSCLSWIYSWLAAHH